jgi:hypothetical protein
MLAAETSHQAWDPTTLFTKIFWGWHSFPGMSSIAFKLCSSIMYLSPPQSTTGKVLEVAGITAGLGYEYNNEKGHLDQTK